MAVEEGRDGNPLIGGRLMVRNTIWNLAGRSVPAVVAILCIPPILRMLGPDRFGLLGLALTFIGYFGLLDLGIGRAITQAISEKIGQGQESEAPQVVWNGLTVLTGLSLIGVVLCALFSPVLVQYLKVPNQLRAEAVDAFYILSLSIPLVVLSAALWGVLAAYQRFDLGNRLNIPLGIATYVGPVLVLKLSDTLVAVMTTLLLLRLAGCIGMAVMCLRIMPGLKHRFRLELHGARRLVAFGGWLTLSSVLSSLMASIDRFAVGAIVSVTAVAYYGTAYDVVSKMSILSVAVLSVLAPAMAASIASGSNRSEMLFERSVYIIFFSLLSICLVIILFAQEGIALWINRDFSEHSATIFQVLAVGVFLNSLTQAPIVAMISCGRPDVAAKVHIVEFPIFLLVMYGSILYGGLHGAAAAWTVRALVEAIVVFLLSSRLVLETRKATKVMLAAIPAALIVFAAAGIIKGIWWKIFFACAIQFAVWIGGWHFVLVRAEKDLLLSYIRHIRMTLRARA